MSTAGIRFSSQLYQKMSTKPPERLERRVSWFSTICAKNQATFKLFDEVMTFSGRVTAGN
jgi:hypothetical protein